MIVLTLLPETAKDKAPPTVRPMGTSWAVFDRETRKAGRIHLFLAKESVLDNLYERHNRPYKFYKEQLLPPLLKALALHDLDLEFRWSQKAGCSCGCSPGFVVTGGKDSWKLRGHFITASYVQEA